MIVTKIGSGLKSGLAEARISRNLMFQGALIASLA
jgi:hypothetical protein